MKSPKSSKDDPIKYFQLESRLKNKNIMTMGKLVERINRIQVQLESVDKEAIPELYSEKLNQDLIQHIVKSKIKRNSKF
ncbi:MAG: hypothetical protein QWI37_04565 [Candidatus Cardinium sp.]|nr:hypothetical protein [Candidatus Cardinium sp.]